MVKARKYIRVQHFDGMPKQSDFRVETEELEEIKNGEILCEAVFFSVDPYMRIYAASRPLGQVMFGSQIARILQSKNPKFPEGKYVCGNFGWRTHTIYDANAPPTPGMLPSYLVPEVKGHPLSLYLGLLGMTGNTAYFGFTETCKPKAGETVVVSGAAGAVGSQVGQIAKILGLKVIGIAGSDEKGKWLKSIGFDDYINYKTTNNLAEDLKKKAPNGVDCYFDNVGGEMSSTVMYQMNKFGRVGLCGSISSYNDKGEMAKATIVQPAILMSNISILPIHATFYLQKWKDGIKQNTDWLLEGKLQYNETVYEGFDNIVNAFVGMLKGENTGKAVVKV